MTYLVPRSHSVLHREKSNLRFSLAAGDLGTRLEHANTLPVDSKDKQYTASLCPRNTSTNVPSTVS